MVRAALARPLSGSDLRAEQKAGGDRALLRWTDRAEDRRQGRRSSDRGHRQRADQRGAAVAVECIEVRGAGVA